MYLSGRVRLKLPRTGPIPALAVVTSVVVGVVAAISPLVAALAVVGLVIAVVTTIHPAVGVALLIVVDMLSGFPALAAHQSALVKVTGATLVVCLFLHRLNRRLSGRRGDGLTSNVPAAFITLGAFLVWVVLSTSWSIDAGTTISDLQRFGLNAIFLVIVASVMSTDGAARGIPATFVFAGAAAALSGVAVTSDEFPGRLTGTLQDANYLASVLVTTVILAAALALITVRPGLRLVFGAITAGALVGLFLTESRGGLIALVASLGLVVVFGGRWRRALALATALVGAICLTLYLVVASSSGGGRLEEVGDGSGRTDLWTVGIRAFEDRPILGSGLGTYMQTVPQYLVQPGLLTRADLVINTPRVAHNMYLHLLVELGLVGLVLFVGVLGVCAHYALRASQLFADLGDWRMEILSRAHLVALGGTLTADFFLSAQYEKPLWLLLGAGPGLYLMARRRRLESAYSSAYRFSQARTVAANPN